VIDAVISGRADHGWDLSPGNPERRGLPMASSEILQDKLILAVDDEEDVLDIIEEELSEASNCTLHRATTFEKAQQYLVSYTYDLVILDIMGVRGFDLLQIATNAGFPVVMLTAHAFTPEALKKSIELGARAYLPKEKLGSLVPFLEDVLKLNYRSVWSSALDHVGLLFNKRFGSDWRTSEQDFWDDFEKKLTVEEAAILK
jgi:CheY-like chemotaxis protein